MNLNYSSQSQSKKIPQQKNEEERPYSEFDNFLTLGIEDTIRKKKCSDFSRQKRH